MTLTPPDPYAFDRYREYLAAFFAWKKRTTRSYSYRLFARQAGCASPNYLQLVISGRRSITYGMAERFAKACRLDAAEAAYFIALVAHESAENPAAAQAHWERIVEMRRLRQLRQLSEAQRAYHEHWYLPAIRELVGTKGFRADPAWIAEQLTPPITAEQAAEALMSLERLQLIFFEKGALRQCDALVSTGAETSRAYVAAFHRAMLERAADSLDLIPAAERDISSVTLTLSNEGLRNCKQRLRQFRRELLALSEEDTEDARVVQLNLQLFPLSQAPSS